MLTKNQKEILNRLKSKPTLLDSLDPDLFSNKEFMLEALKIESRYILYASLELCLDTDFKQKALEIDSHIEKYFKTRAK